MATRKSKCFQMNDLGPSYTIPDCSRIGLLFASDYFSHRIGVSFTLSRSDPVRHVGAKSLRSGGDTKNNPILCRAVNYRV